MLQYLLLPSKFVKRVSDTFFFVIHVEIWKKSKQVISMRIIQAVSWTCSKLIIIFASEFRCDRSSPVVIDLLHTKIQRTTHGH